MQITTHTPREPAPRAGSVTCLAFKRHISGSLRGFVDLHLPRHRLKIFGCGIHESHGKRWVALPTKPVLSRERQLVTDERGKIKYTPAVAWDGDQTRYAFSDAAVEAVIAYDPSAFSDGE